MHLLPVILSIDKHGHYSVLDEWGVSGLRIRLAMLLALIIFSTIPVHADAEEAPCIILAKADEWYNIGLSGITDSSESMISFKFDHEQPVKDRLEVQGSLKIENDLFTNSIYYIKNGSLVLCTVHYKGLDSVLLGEERARLEITSDVHHVHLIGIQIDDVSTELDIPPSFQIVLLRDILQQARGRHAAAASAVRCMRAIKYRIDDAAAFADTPTKGIMQPEHPVRCHAASANFGMVA